jgi:hypothetical protein
MVMKELAPGTELEEVPRGYRLSWPPGRGDIRSVGVRRLGARLGQPPPAVIAELDKALRLHLGL